MEKCSRKYLHVMNVQTVKPVQYDFIGLCKLKSINLKRASTLFMEILMKECYGRAFFLLIARNLHVGCHYSKLKLKA